MALSPPLIYSRIDYVLNEEGQPELIEFEGIDCELFMRFSEERAGELFAKHILNYAKEIESEKKQ